jgi:hypothetical protein
MQILTGIWSFKVAVQSAHLSLKTEKMLKIISSWYSSKNTFYLKSSQNNERNQMIVPMPLFADV